MPVMDKSIDEGVLRVEQLHQPRGDRREPPGDEVDGAVVTPAQSRGPDRPGQRTQNGDHHPEGDPLRSAERHPRGEGRPRRLSVLTEPVRSRFRPAEFARHGAVARGGDHANGRAAQWIHRGPDSELHPFASNRWRGRPRGEGDRAGPGSWGAENPNAPLYPRRSGPNAESGRLDAIVPTRPTGRRRRGPCAAEDLRARRSRGRGPSGTTAPTSRTPLGDRILPGTSRGTHRRTPTSVAEGHTHASVARASTARRGGAPRRRCRFSLGVTRRRPTPRAVFVRIGRLVRVRQVVGNGTGRRPADLLARSTRRSCCRVVHRL